MTVVGAFLNTIYLHSTVLVRDHNDNKTIRGSGMMLVCGVTDTRMLYNIGGVVDDRCREHWSRLSHHYITFT